MSGMKYGLQARCVELAAQVADLQQTFDLQWEADMRAVKMWREAHPGNELVLPDRANMVVWLLEQHDALAAPPASPLRGRNLLERLRDYLDINAQPGNDLAPKFSREISELLSASSPEQPAAAPDVV